MFYAKVECGKMFPALWHGITKIEGLQTRVSVEVRRAVCDASEGGFQRETSEYQGRGTASEGCWSSAAAQRAWRSEQAPMSPTLHPMTKTGQQNLDLTCRAPHVQMSISVSAFQLCA